MSFGLAAKASKSPGWDEAPDFTLYIPILGLSLEQKSNFRKNLPLWQKSNDTKIDSFTLFVVSFGFAAKASKSLGWDEAPDFTLYIPILGRSLEQKSNFR